MSKWLALARSQIRDLPLVPNVPKSPKYLPNGNFGNFGNFGTGTEDGTRHECQPRVTDKVAADIDEAEREAIAIELGGVPETYASAFAVLKAHAPPGVPMDRWHQFINDAGAFLDHWGQEAERLGWTAEELFGLQPDAPMARYDSMGMIWLIRGQTVIKLDATSAKLSGGLRIRRRLQ